MQMYRWRPWGRTADFLVLDSRQYRAGASMLGAEQEQWLLGRLRASTARWRVLTQQVFFSRRMFPGSPPTLSADAWDGYPEQRSRIIAAARESGVPNLVVVSGDVHNNWASEVLADFHDPASASVGVEFVGTAVSSQSGAVDANAIFTINPHIKFFEGHRGYVMCTAGPQEFHAEYRVVDYVDRQGAPVHTAAGFLVDNGRLKRDSV
jgi:alkaline phosphatase D